MTPAAPPSDYRFLADTLDVADAAAFVHVGDGNDADLRYLSHLSPSTHDYGFVYANKEATLCVPSDVDDAVLNGFAGRVSRESLDAPVGRRVVDVLDTLDVPDTNGVDGGPTVLVPQHLPHDTAVYLESAGYDLASTPAVGDARAVKSSRELDALRAVQRATVRGMSRARTILSESVARDGGLSWQGAPLSTERLRRQVNATLVAEGVVDVSTTRIQVGAATGTESGDDPTELRGGVPLVVSLAPRGPRGYYGTLRRTFVVDSDGGWERRAHVGIESARRVALGELEPGASLRWVHSEAVAEASSFGLTGPDSDRVSGIGLSRREAPSLADDAIVGHVVTVEARAVDDTHGTIVLADVAVVTEDGCELLAESPTKLVP